MTRKIPLIYDGLTSHTDPSYNELAILMKVKVSLPGVPHSKARHRTTRDRRGKTSTYDPQHENKITTQWKIKAQTVGHDLVDLSEKMHLSIRVIFEMPIPKSSKAKAGSPHTKKPDIDNLLKFILDAGNGLLWKDDSKIHSITAVKVYSSTPQTTLVAEYALCEQTDILQQGISQHFGQGFTYQNRAPASKTNL